MSDYINAKLEIVPKSFFKSEYELQANGECILSLKSTTFWGTLYEINGLGNCWELYKPSIWKSKLELREKGKEMPVSYYEQTGWKSRGTVYLPRGEKLNLIFNIWKSSYEFQDDSNKSVVLFKNKSFFSSTIEITLIQKTELIEKYPYALFLAFYVALQRQHHAAAAAG
jgi:hypothetical protein